MVKTIKVTKGVQNNLVRRVINAESYSEQEQQGIIKLYQALVPGDDVRQIDVQMIVTEGFPKFEETIGEEAFAKIKKYFGLSNEKSRKIKDIEANILIARLRTIENAQYYIDGYKQLIKKVAAKLLNAPDNMSDLEKAKIIRMFFVVLAENEIFLEDYKCKIINGKQSVFFDEEKAFANNKCFLRPEELFDIYAMKVAFSEGYYYDMMIMFVKNMYIEYIETNSKYKKELVELLEFSELSFDGEHFSSVNKCTPNATFGQIRKLKQRLHKVYPVYALEMFCNKKTIADKLDFTDIYIVYKTLNIIKNWEIKEKKKIRTYRSMSGSRFVDKEQAYYEVFDNFVIADRAEAERWKLLYEYVTSHELTLKTKYDGEGNELDTVETYNAGTLDGILRYSMEMGYINKYTRVIWDFSIIKSLLSLESAEEIFLKFKRNEIKACDVSSILGIDEVFENEILHIEKLDLNKVVEEIVKEQNKEDENTLVKEDVDVDLANIVIQFALTNHYAEFESDIDRRFIEEVVVPGNEEVIKEFSKGAMKREKFERKIGFETKFARSYFNASNVDIKVLEAKLQEIKKSTNKDKINSSKLIVKLYCYIIKNGIPCGPKHKVPKRNKGLKPEILESLIA